MQTAARGTCRVECRSAYESHRQRGRDGHGCHGFTVGMLAVGHASVKFVGLHTHTHMWRGPEI